MISRFFIDHPRAAWAFSVILVLCGVICLRRMPISEYPRVAPCTVSTYCSYTGASAQDLIESVATVLEDEVNSVEDLWYYKSTSNEKGAYQLHCVFRPGINSDVALMNVQNAVKRAEPRLPTEVTKNGFSIRKSPEDRMVMYCFLTDGRQMDIMDLSNFVEKQIADAISRVEGVGQVSTSGATYSMRIWLDPIRLSGLNIPISEVKAALESQNIQAAAGTIGAEYASSYLTFKLNVQGRLKTKEEFENIIIRTNPATGAMVRVKDVARVELGCKGYSIRSRFNENPTVYFEVYKSPEANSVATAQRVKAEVDKWVERLPEGVSCVLADDTTAFTIVFLKETVKTLLIALLLVVAITYLFLQDIRATLVPTIAIPISLLATFAVLYPLGYTINVLTMFGLILVIGSLVDDAIVVVENTQAIMLNEGLSPPDAARKSMSQITGAIIATTLVTLACYLPLTFTTGMAGKMYVQFAVSMCVALCFSTVVALVLSPALCATILRPPRPRRVFAPFNCVLEKSRSGYLVFVRFFVRHALLTLLAFAAACLAARYFSSRIPSTFLPSEDRGYIRWSCRLAEGQSLEKTIEVVDAFHERVASIAGILSMSSSCGRSNSYGTGENVGGGMLRLLPWDQRTTPDLTIGAIMDRLRTVARDFPAAEFTFNQPPAIKGLAGSSGVCMNFTSIMGCEPEELLHAADDFVATLKRDSRVKDAMHGYTCATPCLELRLDRAKTEMLGLTPKDIFATLQNKLASFYVNDFNIKGGVYQVKLQNESAYRASIADIRAIHIPTAKGVSVPLTSVASIEYRGGARELQRYNKFLMAWVDVTPAEGVASSEVMDMIEALPKPPGFEIFWGPLQSQERENQGQIAWLLAAALAFAYLFLVAQYESWSIPLAVMLSVVFALMGAYFGLWLLGLPFSIYAQLGCVMLIGLAAKNAILMVEFAKQEHARGVPVAEAARRGASLRYRAVMMTAWSFIIGVLPLVLARGAGAASMRAIGVCTAAGMLAATLVGIVFVPALYALCSRFRKEKHAT